MRRSSGRRGRQGHSAAGRSESSRQHDIQPRRRGWSALKLYTLMTARWSGRLRAAELLLALLVAGLLAGCGSGRNSAPPVATVSSSTARPATERPSTSTPAPTSEPSGAPFVSVGDDIFQMLPPGDPEAGRRISGARDCTNCHIRMPVGPLWTAADEQPSMAERASQRILQADYTGQAMTAEQYLLESIISPDIYVVEGYPAGMMPDRLGLLLGQQEAADLIAYMMSIE